MSVKASDILDIKDDLMDCIGLDNKALDQRVSKALDRLDAKHLDAVAHILALAALVARRMANQRGREEDAEQEREQMERDAFAAGALRSPFTHPPQRRIG